MIGIYHFVSNFIHAYRQPYFSCVLVWAAFTVILLFSNCAINVWAQSLDKIHANPMIKLANYDDDTMVTGYIGVDEWKRKEIKSKTCWEANLLNFKVEQVFGKEAEAICVRKGVNVPGNVDTVRNPNVIINADCSANKNYPAARVRICQPKKPDELEFTYSVMEKISGEGATLTIKAEHFRLGGKKPTSLKTFVSHDDGKKSVNFLLGGTNNDSVMGSGERVRSTGADKSPLNSSASLTIDETLNTFLSLLGKDLFVETYISPSSQLPEGKGKIWQDPSIPLDWNKAIQKKKDHVKIHTDLGLIKCLPDTAKAWGQLQLADCFSTVELRQGTEDHYIFLTWQQSLRDPIAVVKAYRGSKSKQIIRIPRMQSDIWKVKDLTVSPTYSTAYSSRKSKTATYTLDNFVTLGIPSASKPEKGATTVRFTAPSQTVLEVFARDTVAFFTLAFDREDVQSLSLGAGKYELYAYREGHNVLMSTLEIKISHGQSLKYNIIHNGRKVGDGKSIIIKPKRIEMTKKRTSIVNDAAVQAFVDKYGINTDGLYVGFAHPPNENYKFAIPVTAKLYIGDVIKRFAIHFIYDEKERYSFQRHAELVQFPPLYKVIQPKYVAIKLVIKNILDVRNVQYKHKDTSWKKVDTKVKELFLWAPLDPRDTVLPATESISIRVCSDSGTLYSTSFPKKLVHDVLDNTYDLSDWKSKPAQEHILVFLSGDSATFEARLEQDGENFFKTTAEIIKKHQQSVMSNDGATVVYGMGMDGRFQQFESSTHNVLPTEFQGMQDLDQSLAAAFDILSKSSTTRNGSGNPCGKSNFRLVYIGYSSSLSKKKVPSVFSKVDVLTPTSAGAGQHMSSSRFREHMVRNKQDIVDRFNTLLPAGVM